MNRQILAEGKFDCETGEYYKSYSTTFPNEHSDDPNATITQEQYACARYGKVPTDKEIITFEELKELRDKNRDTIYMLFIPCNHMKNKTYMCKY